MYRFYIPNITGESISLDDVEQLHHLRDVLRLKTGDEVIVFDGKGSEYVCVIEGLNKKQARLVVKAAGKAQIERATITIACALPRQSKMDEIIDQLTQLGVDNIIPMQTERVVVRLADSKKDARLQRWRKIAESAARQSRRSSLPVVSPITGLENIVANSGSYDLKLIPTVSGERARIKEVLEGVSQKNILVLIGPEGDFTAREVEMAKNSGFIPVSLGDSVLRVGTAAVAVVSFLKLYLMI